MPVGSDICRRQRYAGRSLLGAERCQLLQWLWRGEFGTQSLVLLLQDLDRHEPRALLEEESLRQFRRLSRQHKGRADLGMTREPQVFVHGADADLRVTAALARRRHERRV